MSIKVAVIGAGSVGFTRGMCRDILCVPEFQDTEFAFTDINQRNLDMVYQLCKRDIEANGLPAKVTRHHRTAARRSTDANYVFCFVRVGGLEAFADRHRHPAEVRRGPVRRRHALRRRHHVRPAHHPRAAGFLQGHQRSRRARLPVPQLLQPDGDEHLGVQQVRQA